MLPGPSERYAARAIRKVCGPQTEPQDQYDVERFALADRNHNLPSETGLHYPSLLAMNNRHLMTSRILVTSSDIVYIPVCTSMYYYALVHTGMFYLIPDILYHAQADTRQSSGCVRLDINLLKPSRLNFQDQDLAPNLTLPVGHLLCASPDWLEYVYRSTYPILRWLPTKLAEWIGENLQEALGFPDKGDARASAGWSGRQLS
jgi:hypothetical protein